MNHDSWIRGFILIFPSPPSHSKDPYLSPRKPGRFQSKATVGSKEKISSHFWQKSRDCHRLQQACILRHYDATKMSLITKSLSGVNQKLWITYINLSDLYPVAISHLFFFACFLSPRGQLPSPPDSKAGRPRRQSKAIQQMIHQTWQNPMILPTPWVPDIPGYRNIPKNKFQAMMMLRCDIFDVRRILSLWYWFVVFFGVISCVSVSVWCDWITWFYQDDLIMQCKCHVRIMWLDVVWLSLMETAIWNHEIGKLA